MQIISKGHTGESKPFVMLVNVPSTCLEILVRTVVSLKDVPVEIPLVDKKARTTDNPNGALVHEQHAPDGQRSTSLNLDGILSDFHLIAATQVVGQNSGLRAVSFRLIRSIAPVTPQPEKVVSYFEKLVNQQWFDSRIFKNSDNAGDVVNMTVNVKGVLVKSRATVAFTFKLTVTKANPTEVAEIQIKEKQPMSASSKNKAIVLTAGEVLSPMQLALQRARQTASS